MLFCEEYKLGRSLFSDLEPPVAASVSDPNILLSISFSFYGRVLEGSQQGHLARAPGLERPKYTLQLIINKQKHRKFRLIELLNYYSWRFIDIRLNYLGDRKNDF
jgi:hypothetical protein